MGYGNKNKPFINVDITGAVQDEIDVLSQDEILDASLKVKDEFKQRSANIKWVGASGSILETTGSITSGFTLLTVTNRQDFNVGNGVFIAGAGAGGSPLIAEIIAINGNDFTLDTAASTTVSGVNIKHDDTKWIRETVVNGYNVFMPEGEFNVSSAITIVKIGQEVRGSGKSKTTLNMLTASDLFILNANHVKISDFKTKGTYTMGSDTRRDAAISIQSSIRSHIYNVEIFKYGIGISWENATNGYMNDISNSRINVCHVGAWVKQSGHAVSIRTGNEIVGCKYGVIVGDLNADGSPNRDYNPGVLPAASLNIVYNIIEGNQDLDIFICNAQNKTNIIGNYFESRMDNQPNKTGMIEIGSRKLNDNVTEASGIAIATTIKDNYFYVLKLADPIPFPVIKAGRVKNGEISGNSSLSDMPFIDHSDCGIWENVDIGNNYVNNIAQNLTTVSNIRTTNKKYPDSKMPGVDKSHYAWDSVTASYKRVFTTPSTLTDSFKYSEVPVEFEKPIILPSGNVSNSKITALTGTATVNVNNFHVIKNNKHLTVFINGEINLSANTVLTINLDEFIPVGLKLVRGSNLDVAGQYWNDGATSPHINSIAFVNDTTLKLSQGTNGSIPLGVRRFNGSVNLLIG